MNSGAAATKEVALVQGRIRLRLLTDSEPSDIQTLSREREQVLRLPKRERQRAATLRADWTDPIQPEAESLSGARLLAVPHVRLVPDLTTVSHNTTMYVSMSEPLNRSSETFINKSLLREENGHEGHSSYRSRTKMSQIAALILG